MSDLQSRIEVLWEGRDSLSADDSEVVATVHEAIDALDTGTARVAEWNPDGSVTVNQWVRSWGSSFGPVQRSVRATRSVLILRLFLVSVLALPTKPMKLKVIS